MRGEDGPVDPESNPFHRVVEPWERVVEDMAATAEEYERAGREVVSVHPGDVAVLTGEPRTLAEEQGDYEPEPQRLGLDVVIPGEEFETLHAVADSHEFDTYEAYRAVAGGVVFALLVFESADEAAVVLVPVYFEVSDLQDLRTVAEEYGLYTHVRPLDREAVVTFTHADPAPLLPESGDL